MNHSIWEAGKKLPLMEAFYTIQGEGAQMGKAAYFLRIGGCDVGCSWCDTKPSWEVGKFPPVAVDSIVDEAIGFPAKTVVVTGGEPSMYPLDYLTNELHARGIRTMVETSGAYELSGQWDWICLSPKKYSPPRLSIYKKANELKVVIQNKGDINWAEENASLVNENCALFLQPEWSRTEEVLPWLTDYIMNHPKWRISLQSHKYMNLP